MWQGVVRWMIVIMALFGVENSLLFAEQRVPSTDEPSALSGTATDEDQSQTSAATTSTETKTETKETGPTATHTQPEKPLRLSMEFQNATLKDVLKAFSQQSGINVIASSDVSEKPITLYLEDVTVMDALDQILRAGNLTYERAPNSEIYIVKPKAEAPKTPPSAQPITRIYKLKYARVSKSILAKAATAFGAKTPFEGSSEGKTTTSSSSSGGASASGSSGSGQEGVGIDVVVKELLTDQGTMVVDGRTNSLIITDIPENFPRLEAALATLDVRTPQIMVDTEVIETSLTKLKDLGVEWGDSTGSVFTLTPAKANTRFPFSNLFGAKVGGGGLHDNTSDGKDAKLTLGTLGTDQAVAVLKMLETDGTTKILARPKVLTLDNESAMIRLTADEAIGFTQTNQAQTSAITSEPERTRTGVVLVVTPQVNDQSYITMLVEPSVTKTVASNIKAPTGQANPRDPKTRSARSIVRVHSGDTLVVGGLIDRSESTSLQRVPILSGIPIFGEAFKEQGVNNSSSELIVFLTPTILSEPQDIKMASSAAQGSMGLREQEPSGDAKDEAIEQRLNTLEKPKL